MLSPASVGRRLAARRSRATDRRRPRGAPRRSPGRRCSGRVERREAAVLGGVRVGAVLEQELHDPRLPARGGAVQRRHVDVRVARDEVHLGPALDEEPGGVLLAEERRVVQRREAVRRPRAARARALPRAAPRGRASGRPPPRRRRRAAGWRRAASRRGSPAVVERVQHRREPVRVSLGRELGPAPRRGLAPALVAGRDRVEQLLAPPRAHSRRARSSGRVRQVGPPSPFREISSPR